MRILLLIFFSCLLFACNDDYEIPHATVEVVIEVIEAENYSAVDLGFDQVRKRTATGQGADETIGKFSLAPDLLDAGQADFTFDLDQATTPFLTLYTGVGDIESVAPRFTSATILDKTTGEERIIDTCVPEWMALPTSTTIEAGATYQLTFTMDMNQLHVINGVWAVDFTYTDPVLTRK
ncbi:hypothetical protein [Neolewinella maritima]|uniref:hypothetical protein n=1 Tax=Neolewinella maritima TaxID=1383882 RepID=UPI001EE9301E|nr:hypothetical protein [Neolewinella maritima]